MMIHDQIKTFDLIDDTNENFTSLKELKDYFKKQYISLRNQIAHYIKSDDSFKIRIERDYCHDCPGKEIAIIEFFRSETEKEIKNRLEKEERLKKQAEEKAIKAKIKQEQQELKLLKKLAKKYGYERSEYAST